jgi:hypothetical protein
MATVGEEIVIRVKTRNKLGVLTDPASIKGRVLPDDGVPVDLVFAKATTGIWEAPFLVAKEGEHVVRVETTGIKAAKEKTFFAEEQRVKMT